LLYLHFFSVFCVHLKLVFHGQISLLGIELQVLYLEVGVQNHYHRVSFFFHNLQAVDMGDLIKTVYTSDVFLLGIGFILRQELDRFNVSLVSNALVLKKEAEINCLMLVPKKPIMGQVLDHS